MILEQYIPALERLRQYYKEPMLLLGDQEFKVPFDFGVKFFTLDIQGNPDIEGDLTVDELPDKIGRFGSVFNLGTLEHIWDVHAAYSVAARLVRSFGYYIGHHPVAGWEGHGIHVTNPRRILNFFGPANGFQVETEFYTTKEGELTGEPSRNCGQSIILWFASRKINEVKTYERPIDLC